MNVNLCGYRGLFILGLVFGGVGVVGWYLYVGFNPDSI